MVKFNATREENETIVAIVDRAMPIVKAHGVPVTRRDLMMDITAVHANGMPLRLQELLEADAFNFSHDIFGILRYIDRRTGTLGDCFVPRFAAHEKPVVA